MLSQEIVFTGDNLNNYMVVLKQDSTDRKKHIMSWLYNGNIRLNENAMA